MTRRDRFAAEIMNGLLNIQDYNWYDHPEDLTAEVVKLTDLLIKKLDETNAARAQYEYIDDFNKELRKVEHGY